MFSLFGYFLGRYSYFAWKKWGDGRACPGPLIEHQVVLREGKDETGHPVWYVGSILMCSRCSYIVTTGNFHDRRHTDTPIVEGEGPRWT